MKVLLVDDDRLVLEGLKQMVDWKTLQADVVGLAENGQDAIALATSNSPDVVITDVSMPVMDGIELVRILSESMPGTSVVFISGHDDFEYARQALRYGVKDYVLKPMDRQAIQNLEDILLRIKNEQMTKESHYRSLWSKENDQEIFAALKEGDTAFFNSLFTTLTKDCKIVPANTVTVCLRLLQILYQYLNMLQIFPEGMETSQQNAFEGMLALRNLDAKLNYVFQLYYDAIEGIHATKNQSTYAIAVAAKQKVQEDFSTVDFNITLLADQLGCTPSYLSTVFRQYMGVNLSVYITTLRMDYSKELLADPANTVSDVAQIVGYADSHYFGRLFKKQTGLTPTEFRTLSIQSDTIA